MHKYIYLITVLILIQLSQGCSGGASKAVLPQDETSVNSIPLPVEKPDELNRNFLGSWTAEFNLERMEVKLETYRDLAIHYNATSLIPAPAILINSYDAGTGIIDVDLTISNPYPVTVYDPRIILFTDSVGHKLLNADSWTALYDRSGGLPINPFKAFAQDKPNQKFAGQSQLTENLKIRLPGGNPSVVFAIDASYPGNCEEPYEINSFIQEDLFENIGSTSQAQINVYDWTSDADSVKLYCPAITGTALVAFSQQTLETWIVSIENNTGAGPGDYSAFIVATSENSGNLALYNEITIQILSEGDTGWAQTWGGVDDTSATFPMGVAVDESHGFVYTVGGFMGTVDFDPGPNTLEFSSTSGDMFAFVSKYDLDGNFQTAFTFGDGADNGYFQAIRIANDSIGDIYVCGNFMGTIDFQPGPNHAYRTSNGGTDFFIARYSPSGSLYWVLASGGSYKDYCFNVTVDDSNKIYVGGIFESTMDFNPGTGVEERTPNGYDDAFVVCYNRSGTFQWVNTFGGYYSTYCIGLDTEDNDIYATGYFDGVVDFDPGAGVEERTATGSVDCYLLKYDNLGNFQAVNTWGGSWSEDTMGYSVGIDNTGNSFVQGVYDGYVDFNPGPGVDTKSADSDGPTFICKFDPSFNYQWVKTFQLETQLYNVDRMMTVSDDSNVFLTGAFSDTVDFDPGPEVFELTSVGYNDMYLVKLNTDGGLEWAYSWGDVSSDANTYVDTDSRCNSYTVGSFSGTVDFDPGTGVDEHSSGDSLDGVLMKINTNGHWN